MVDRSQGEAAGILQGLPAHTAGLYTSINILSTSTGLMALTAGLYTSINIFSTSTGLMALTAGNRAFKMLQYGMRAPNNCLYLVE